jgi:hypothetical protein
MYARTFYYVNAAPRWCSIYHALCSERPCAFEYGYGQFLLGTLDICADRALDKHMKVVSGILTVGMLAHGSGM